jgi:MFS family permease
VAISHSLTWFVTRGLNFAFGSFQSFYTLTFIPSSTASAISWVGTIQSWLLIACGLLSGPLFDLGYFPAMVIAGSFFSVFGFMMLSLSHEFYAIFLSQGICMGLGFGLLYVPTVALISRRFETNRAVALGVATSGAPAGGIIYTVIFNQLISRVGFGWTVRVMGFVMLFLFIGAALLLSSEGGLKSRAVNDRPRILIDMRALKDLPFWSFTVANFLIYLGYITPYYYIPTYAQTRLHTSRSLGSYILMASQGASIVGRVATTVFAHYYGSMVSWVLCGLISGILCLSWISADTLPRFIVFVAFYGTNIPLLFADLN